MYVESLHRIRAVLWSAALAVALLAATGAYAQPLPGGTLDPTTIPKYVSPLVIPPQMPKSADVNTPVADYNIAVRQFKQQILPGGIWTAGGGLPATTVWSYGRAEDPAPDSSLITGGAAGVAPATNSTFNYPAFTVENLTGVTAKVRWINDLKDPATGRYLTHLFPVDQTLHWANPSGVNCLFPPHDRTDCETDVPVPYLGPVPLVTHVHGAHVQGHSDGYPEAWWLPAANNLPGGFHTTGRHFGQGDTTNTVPGSAFFVYENTQPAATIWYHDHALGITRLNVYAGPAGFWLIRGGAHGDAFVDDGTTPGAADGVLPAPAPSGAGDPNFAPTYRDTIREVPVVIQDRSFNTDGSLFYPDSRTFFDGFTGPYIGGTGIPTGFSDISGIWNPEAFFNTMVTNGTTWPLYNVAPARYRLRLLNGCNSRTLNLSLFVVTDGGDGIWGNANDVITATELPFYQIGGDQGFLQQVVKISKGFATPLPGNGTLPADTPLPSVDQALLLMPAERADVIIDFTGLPDGTRIRMLNTAPDAPFGGFPDVAADPGTTGQVMDFVVSSLITQPSDANTTPAANLVLPAESALTGTPIIRQLSLNEMSSDQVCVEVDAATGAIIQTLFSVPPGDPTFLATCAAAAVSDPVNNVPAPMGPRQALLGLVTVSGGNLVAVPKRWEDAPSEIPLLNTTELWELYNTTADAHPIHLHLVRFEIVNREDLDATQLLAGNLVPTGVIYAPLPTEAGFKDTVTSYPGQVTRVKAEFNIDGLYVWHCHILEHEDNEMMRHLLVNADLLYANQGADGLWRWDSGAWSKINTAVPVSMTASGATLYANFTGAGLWTWDGTAWTQINTAIPESMQASGTTLYANFTGSGLWKWDGSTWSQINTAIPASMQPSGTALYANFTGAGLWKWDGSTWTQINTAIAASMQASGTDLYANFTGAGLWKWDGSAWTRINEALAAGMTASGSDLYASFTGAGLWKWDGSTWTRINASEPAVMMAAGPNLYATFAGAGLWKYSYGTWQRINAAEPATMMTSGTNLYADFTGNGLWKWQLDTWSQLWTGDPTIMATAF